MAGCIATIGRDGTLQVIQGLVKPEDMLKDTGAAANGHDADVGDDNATDSSRVDGPAITTPLASPVDPRAKAREEAGVGIGLADDLRAIRTALIKAHFAGDFEAAFDLVVFQMVRAVFARGYTASWHALDIKFNETADRPTTRTNDDDFASWSLGEAMLADWSHLPFEWMEGDDDAACFAALRALPRADKEKLFAAAVARTVKGQLAFEYDARPELEATDKTPPTGRASGARARSSASTARSSSTTCAPREAVAPSTSSSMQPDGASPKRCASSQDIRGGGTPPPSSPPRVVSGCQNPASAHGPGSATPSCVNAPCAPTCSKPATAEASSTPMTGSTPCSCAETPAPTPPALRSSAPNRTPAQSDSGPWRRDHARRVAASGSTATETGPRWSSSPRAPSTPSPHEACASRRPARAAPSSPQPPVSPARSQAGSNSGNRNASSVPTTPTAPVTPPPSGSPPAIPE